MINLRGSVLAIDAVMPKDTSIEAELEAV